jgi:hypothetical protein
MKELMIFVERHQGGDAVSLLPVFLGLTCDQCFDVATLYATEEFWADIPESHRRHAEGKHGDWAKAVKYLLGFTGVKKETVGPLAPSCSGPTCPRFTGCRRSTTGSRVT